MRAAVRGQTCLPPGLRRPLAVRAVQLVSDLSAWYVRPHFRHWCMWILIQVMVFFWFFFLADFQALEMMLTGGEPTEWRASQTADFSE